MGDGAWGKFSAMLHARCPDERDIMDIKPNLILQVKMLRKSCQLKTKILNPKSQL
jgi:hypothetical protein